MARDPQDRAPDEKQPDTVLLRSDDFSQYLLRTRREILFVLRALIDERALVTLHFDEGRQMILTSILAADESGLILDATADAGRNAAAAAAPKSVCTTAQDKIRIQFALDRLRQTSHEGRAAFAAAVPDTLLRLQRREYYRLATPAAHPLRCEIPLHHGSGPHRTVVARVVDISGGGLAVVVPPEGVPFEAGMEFSGCRIDLPQVGTVVTTLQVRNRFEMTLRNGSTVTRAGCQFVALPGTMVTLIQRYIMRVERERKARQADLAE